MRTRLTSAWMLISVAALLGVTAWLFWAAPADNPWDDTSPIATLLPPGPATESPEPAMDTPKGAMGSLEDESPELAVAAIKRACPWPPTPSTWRELDDSCLGVMAQHEANDQWRFAFEKDPFETRRAVVAALDDAVCHVPADETNPALREACAAEAMVRLAALQDSCVYGLHWDAEEVFARGRAELARDSNGVSQLPFGSSTS